MAALGRRVGYARVSTEEQRTDSQRDQLTQAGCTLVFSDDGVSGSLASRPQFDRCLEQLERGDTLVVVRLDRLGRSMSHLVATVEELAERGVGFRSLSEAIDTTTSTGRLVLGIFASLAQFERDLIRERTRAALAAKKRRGEKLGRPRALTPRQIDAARELLERRGQNVGEVARLFRVDRATLYRALARSAAMESLGLSSEGKLRSVR
jgi:DNA invertase Pin-like site-specific DNA recombinase